MILTFRGHRAPALVLAAALLSGAAAAQEPALRFAEDGREVFEAAFFDRFNAQTAFDMLERAPGFVLDGGDGGVRGFGGGAGNVLIDGERPPTKTELRDVLQRIPAASVARIEILRGGGFAGETGGQGVIANVVRRRDVTSGTWALRFERNPSGRVSPDAEATLTRRFGAWETTSQARLFVEHEVYDIETRTTFDADGNVVRFRDDYRPERFAEISASTEARRPLAGGDFVLNLGLWAGDFIRDSLRVGYPERTSDPARITDVEEIATDYADRELELSAEWARPVRGDWTFKAIGLLSAADVTDEDVSLRRDPVDGPERRRVTRATDAPLELVGRVSLAAGGTGALVPEYGGEIAFNRLESTLFRSADDAAPLPASDVTVEEVRAEAFANLVWRARPGLSVEGGLAVETSEISVSGDASNTQRLTFAKPFIAANWTVSETIQSRFAVRRSVGQLDFGDFAASADVEDDRLFGGNPDLRPDTTTRASAALDWRTEAGAAASVEAYHEWRNDVLEQVVLPSGAFGVGNAGSARVWGIDTSLSLPIERLLTGGLVEVTLNLRDAAIEDPISGETRWVTGFENPDFDIFLRQDRPDWGVSWEIALRNQTDTERYFADETEFSARSTFLNVTLETTRVLDLTTTLDLQMIGGRSFPSERFFYAPDRSGPLTGREVLERDRGFMVRLGFSDTF